MKYNLTAPCDQCPYLIGSGFTYRQLVEHASGEFGCHKQCDSDNDEGVFMPREKTNHCAGALIFLEKRGTSHQMMRICERLGIYDRTKLNMDANVGTKPSDYGRSKRRKA
jgi:hypothetical protein